MDSRRAIVWWSDVIGWWKWYGFKCIELSMHSLDRFGCDENDRIDLKWMHIGCHRIITDAVMQNIGLFLAETLPLCSVQYTLADAILSRLCLCWCPRGAVCGDIPCPGAFSEWDHGHGLMEFYASSCCVSMQNLCWVCWACLSDWEYLFHSWFGGRACWDHGVRVQLKVAK